MHAPWRKIFFHYTITIGGGGGVRVILIVPSFQNFVCLSLLSNATSCEDSPVKIWIVEILISIGSIARTVERRSRNPKKRVQIPLETTNFSLFAEA